ncbi:ubiquinol-cytochrome c reductase iron-sulfur subunit [Tistlia consotensis]|uniref:Ubiquinol-cytochrome c reductase iron-sulfur subunit n=1 Tax=Tistlia consotensis USBA 355 TaxID=560819 RepID=A0A1Y6BT58_9PROT|nr:ubiquinol-cytochrome c reductase iron-sulfur subunit [Tistlia consotensis]SMF27676.1 ubiquinol-cytochrome c reductase iron-sulfur subunit [Tistlia consotensis USBA 355]SNR65825.1 ubiquinol-cytochrome c reductase iron-sulfur subunit [Tistlia consotensis]
MSDKAANVGDMRQAQQPGEHTRRDFLILAAGALGVVGTGVVLWPLIDSMNPAADVRALSTVDVDLGPIEVGQRVLTTWQGKPIFIDHRTSAEIAEARADDHSPALIDPATDAERVQREDWLVVIGICTHLGCVPLGQRTGEPRGPYHGYFCPCHGSLYDTPDAPVVPTSLRQDRARPDTTIAIERPSSP